MGSAANILHCPPLPGNLCTNRYLVRYLLDIRVIGVTTRAMFELLEQDGYGNEVLTGRLV